MNSKVTVRAVGDRIGWELQFKVTTRDGIVNNVIYRDADKHSLKAWLAFLGDPNGELSAKLYRMNGKLHVGPRTSRSGLGGSR